MKNLSGVIGEHLRNLRKQKGLSQEELAHLSSLHPTYIGQVERGEKNITVETLDKITKALGVSLEGLFHSIQPAISTESNNTILPEIFHKLVSLNPEEQKKILSIIEVILEFKKK